MALDFVVLEAINLGIQPRQVPSKTISADFPERCPSLRRVPGKKPVTESLTSIADTATNLEQKRHRYDDILNLAKCNDNDKSIPLSKAANAGNRSETNKPDFSALLAKKDDQSSAKIRKFKIPKRKNDVGEEAKKIAEVTRIQNDESLRSDAQSKKDTPLDSMKKTQPPPAIRTDMTLKQQRLCFERSRRRRAHITADFRAKKAKVGENTAPIPAVNQDLSLDPRRHRLAATTSATLTHAVQIISSVVENAQQPSYAKMHRENKNDANIDTNSVKPDHTVSPEFQKNSPTGSTIPVPAWRHLLVKPCPVLANDDHKVIDMDIESESTPLNCGSPVVEMELHGKRDQQPSSRASKLEYLETPTSTSYCSGVNGQDVPLLLSTCDGPAAKVIPETCPITAGSINVGSQPALSENNSFFMSTAPETAPAETACHQNPENRYRGYENPVFPVANSTPAFPSPTNTVTEAFASGSASTVGGIICSQQRLVLPPLPPTPRVDMDFLHRTSPDMLSTDGQLRWLEQAIARITYFSELYSYRDRVRKMYTKKFV